MIYLDNAATSPVRRQVAEAMWPYLTGEFGNPSSVHSLGTRAAAALADAGEGVAEVLGCSAGEIVFTSGGTESNNLAIKGLAQSRPRGRHLVRTVIEHPSVLESCDYLARQHGFEVTAIDVDGTGMADVAALSSGIRPDTTLVSVMLANNEVGTVQPLAEIAPLVSGSGARLHVDAVQAAGWLELDVAALGVDTLALSGHKFGGPTGVGALYLRRGVRAEPLLHGGGQERGRRSGTQNVAGAVGFALALRLAERDRLERGIRITALRDRFIAQLREAVPSAILTGHPEHRLPFNASFCLPGTSGESVLLELERHGVICSSGSACAAGSSDPSHVLLAMGYSADLAQTAVRFTLGENTTAAELDETVHALRGALDTLGALAR